MKINQVKDDLEECVRSLDLDRARELKEVLEELEVERKQEMESGPLTTPHAPQPSSRQLRNAEDEEDVRRFQFIWGFKVEITRS